MNSGDVPYSRKSFLHGFIHEIGGVIAEFKKNYEEIQHVVDQTIAFEDLPIAATYPRELFEEEANRLGINMDEIGEKEAIKQMVMHQQEEEEAKGKPKT
ncbi:MAG TPA: hypothetical protein VLX29_02760 [Nitrospirota bacterium]|nr:hypothetical protein [Nitrospirota bacterium]